MTRRRIIGLDPPERREPGGGYAMALDRGAGGERRMDERGLPLPAPVAFFCRCCVPVCPEFP